MKEFQKKVLEFSYEIEHSFKESIKHEHLNTVEKDQALRELIKNYSNSKYQRKNTRPYIEYLQNQVSLIDTFFTLTESMRLDSYNFVKLYLPITMQISSCSLRQLSDPQDNSNQHHLLHSQPLCSPHTGDGQF